MTIFVLTSRWPQNILLMQETYFSPYSWWCSRYYPSLCATSKKSINPRWPPIVILNHANSFSQADRKSSFCTGLIWLNQANMILYHSAFWSLAGITLIGDKYVPGVYLLFWRPSWIWHQDNPHLPNKQKQKHNFNTRNGFVALKLVGLEVLFYSPYHIGQNLGIPQIQDVVLAAILDLASRWFPNIILAPEADSSPSN